MTIQTTKNDPDNRGRDRLIESLRTLWLGMRDSNPRSWNQNPLPYHLANPHYCFYCRRTKGEYKG